MEAPQKDNPAIEVSVAINIRAEVDPLLIPEIIGAISAVCLQGNVEVSFFHHNIDVVKEPEPRIITKIDFTDNWNRQGAGQAWQKLIKVSRENTDFPLQFIDNEEYPLVAAQGSINDALEWLKTHPQKGIGFGTLSTILNRLKDEIKL